MKRKMPILVIIFLWLMQAAIYSQTEFRNFDFESALLPEIPADQPGGFVNTSDAIPGWEAFGRQLDKPLARISHNDITLGGAAIIVYGPQWRNSGEILEGSYSVGLTTRAFDPESVVAIAQTGRVPLGSKSLLFYAQAPAVVKVTFGNDKLPFFDLVSRDKYHVYGADVSPYAGLTGELRFTAVAFPPYVAGGTILDNILFSSGDLPFVRSGLRADPLIHWTLRIDPAEEIWDGISTKDGFFLVTGPAGSIRKSADGGTWTEIQVGSPIYSLGYGNGLYLAGGVGRILTSTNGAVWNPGTFPSTNVIDQIVYDGGTFLARDDAGQVSRSTNGTNWMVANLPCCISTIGFGGGFFLAGGGQAGSSSLATSPDGISWTDRLDGTTNSHSGNVTEIAYGFAVGQDIPSFLARTSQKFLYSQDGTNWINIRSVPNVTAVSFTGGTFIGLLDGTNVVTSSDGVVWLKRDNATLSGARGFLFGSGAFLAYGQKGAFQSDPVNKILTIEHPATSPVTELSVFGLLERIYIVDSSTNLTDWTPVTFSTSLQGTVTFSVTNSAPQNIQFYRTRLY
jgi:hypothetical protein